MNIEKEIAQELLAIQAVFLNPHTPFTWASGMKSRRLGNARIRSTDGHR